MNLDKLLAVSKLAVSTALILGTNSLMASQSEPLNSGIHQQFKSTRALGMGNAFTSIVDDHSAILYNPAALGKRKKGVINLNLGLALDPDALQFVDDIDQASNSTNEAAELTNVIVKNYGKSYYLHPLHLGGTWVRPNWGIAILPIDLSVEIGLHRNLGPAVNVTVYQDSTVAYGYGKKLNWGKWATWHGGITLKAIHRMYFNGVASVAQLSQDSELFKSDDFDEGMTLDADLGFLMSPKMPKKGVFSWFQPTFSFVARNIFDYGFKQNFHFVSENSGEPPKMQRRFDLGMSFDTPDLWVFDPKMAIELRDMGHKYWSITKGLHLGAELGWKVKSWWKGYWSVGYSQGYVSYGVGALFAWFQAHLASWGEEVGTSEFPTESRRIQLDLSLDF